MNAPEPTVNGDSTATPVPPASNQKYLIRKVPGRLLTWCTCALIGWLLLFALGLLYDTVEHRLLFSPRAVVKQLGQEGINGLPAKHYKFAKRYVEAAASAKTGQTQDKSSDALVSQDAEFGWWERLESFGVLVVCFTPLNLALLTILAGLAGGCASNIMIQTLPNDVRQKLEDEHPRRVLYLQEPPISAAIRGLVVFLCVIAGLYIAIEDPFKDPTSAQYIRLAGLLSIMAFMVGYDPSRLEDWLRLVPSPGRESATSENKEPPTPPNGTLKMTEIHRTELSTPVQLPPPPAGPSSNPGVPDRFEGVPATLEEATKKARQVEKAGRRVSGNDSHGHARETRDREEKG